MAPFRNFARCMKVTAPMSVRTINLVAPLPHEGTAMRITETSGSAPERSDAVSLPSDRQRDIDSATSTPPTRVTPGIRTSTTATRTTTTSTTSAAPEPSADDYSHPADFSFTDLVEAYRVAKAADMYLIGNGFDIKVSPIIPPGWREIPLRVKTAAPDRGCVCTDQQIAA